MLTCVRSPLSDVVNCLHAFRPCYDRAVLRDLNCRPFHGTVITHLERQCVQINCDQQRRRPAVCCADTLASPSRLKGAGHPALSALPVP